MLLTSKIKKVMRVLVRDKKIAWGLFFTFKIIKKGFESVLGARKNCLRVVFHFGIHILLFATEKKKIFDIAD